MVRSTLALAAVLSVASLSLAADLVTPTVNVTGNVDCRLTNITSAPMPAQIELVFSGDGSVVNNSGPITLAANSMTTISWSVVSYVYCRFVGVNKSKVRADLAVTGGGTDQYVVAAQ